MLLAVLEILPNYAKIVSEFPNNAPDFRLELQNTPIKLI